MSRGRTEIRPRSQTKPGTWEDTIPKVIQGHKQNSNQACNNNMYECWKNIKIFHVMNCWSKFFFFPEHYVNMLLWWIVRHGVSLRIHCPQSHWTAVVQSKIIYIQNLEWPHSRPQSLRSFWPAAGIERLWEQPLQACAIDEVFVKPDAFSSPEPPFLLVTWSTKRRALVAAITGCP